MTTRQEILRELGRDSNAWDVLVIGGGSTGLGAAVEAASRGYRTLLIERIDFAKGTSSRSTKLVHGGVRYLAELDVTLVLDALRERGHMLRNAPHLVHDLDFIVPAYNYAALPYYGMGLKVYEMLSGRLSLGRSELLSRRHTLERLPGIHASGLRGGILYHDGQFDDARYAIALLRTLQDLGGTAVNYVEAAGLIERGGRIAGVKARDREDGAVFEIQAKAVINACGVQADATLGLDTRDRRAPLLAVSQGSHLVLPRSFFPGDSALMIPKTADGRVLFAIPWHGVVIVGTTEEPVETISDEPRAKASERHFLLEHITRYFDRTPQPEEILSVWSGLRPLVRNGSMKTAKLSRDHSVVVSQSGLITVVGGKWTTYRRMGQDAVDRAAQVASLPNRPSRTLEMKLHGWTASGSTDVISTDSAAAAWERVYGSDVPLLRALSAEDSSLDAFIHPRLPYRLREIVWAARCEMARSVEDVLARRTRALFIDARAAIEAAPKVSCVLGRELSRSEAWRQSDMMSFIENAKGYLFQE